MVLKGLEAFHRTPLGEESGHSGVVSPGCCPGCLFPLLTFICVLSLGWTVLMESNGFAEFCEIFQ